jgi:hypothetical protein
MPAGIHDGHLKGELHAMAKLSQKDAETIRSSRESNPALASRYNVHSTTIWLIRSNRRWTHLGE